MTVEIYDDRVEISNFGGLPAGLSKEKFGKKSVRPNLLLADLMDGSGYIERMGIGIKKMRDLVKAEGLRPIKFEFDGFTTVTFFRKLLLTEQFISEDKNFGINFGVKGKKETIY